MAQIEKTVFISYRRKDISWALAVYQYLSSNRYDVFFDYTSLSGGDFGQVIISNIRARAHFVLILTPTALDRCHEPGDWLRREIEMAVDEKRNIIPLFFDGFSFGSPNVVEKLTGKLANINRYNGLDIPSGYFMEAMKRLSSRYLNVPLDAVIHPVSAEVGKKVRDEKVAANKALKQREDIKQLVNPIDTKSEEKPLDKKTLRFSSSFRESRIIILGKIIIERITNSLKVINPRQIGIGTGLMVIVVTGIFIINSLIQNLGVANTPIFPKNGLDVGSIMIGKDGMTLLYVEAGEFTMGDEQSSDNPVHKVYLDSFWINQTEVTNDAFASFLNTMGNQVDGNATWFDAEDDDAHIHFLGDEWRADSSYETHPVIEVSWFGAQAYCSWAGGRLPTEAEWEKAASWNDLSGEKYIYPWGNNFFCAHGNLDDETQVNSYVVSGGENCDGFKRTSPVGSFPSGMSPYGLLDMEGNVWEWVSDLYDPTYNITQEYSNPLGSKSGQYRVIRGGSWLVAEYEATSAYRYRYNPNLPSGNIGFRCAMDAE